MEDIDYMSNNEFVKQITFPEGITIYTTLAPNVEKISFYSSKDKSKKRLFTDIRIKDYANLKEVDLKQVSHLFECSFSDCTGLKKIYFSSLGMSTSMPFNFPGCTNLTDVYFDGTESRWADIVGIGMSDQFRVINNYGDNKEFYKSKKHFKSEKNPNGGYGMSFYGIGSHRDCCMAEQRSNPAEECELFLDYFINEKTLKIPDTVVLYKGGSPVKVTKIGGTFSDENKTTTSVTIGKYVTELWNDGFRNWSNLKKITIRSTELCSHSSSYFFEGIHPDAVIKVPKKKLAAYKKMFKKLKVKVIA